MDLLELLFWPFMACLVLTGIHCYLGIHVVGRGVIFVDLAMAQIAFLGSAVAVLIVTPGHSPAPPSELPSAVAHNAPATSHGTESRILPKASASSRSTEPDTTAHAPRAEQITEEDVEQLIPADETPDADRAHVGEASQSHDMAGYFGGLSFTLLGALLFSFGRMRQRQIPQEAFIGIIYAVSTALALVLLYKAPNDVAERTRDMLVGRILFANKTIVIETACLYAAVGLLHFFLRRPLMMISFQPEEAESRGLAVRWWDFVFYSTFGVIVTSSVQMAGILLVFSYLIVPSVCAMLFFQGITARLWFGWATGFLASVLGIWLSVYLDMPTGASIVITFGGLLILMLMLRAMRGFATA